MAATVLIVDDEKTAQEFVAAMLTDAGFEVLTAETLAAAHEVMDAGAADIVLLDVMLPDGYGPTLLERVAKEQPAPAVILITAFGDIEMAVEAMKLGAQDFLQKPVEMTRLRAAVDRAAEAVALRRELAHLRRLSMGQAEWIIGESPEMKRIADEAQRAAAASTSVLLTGETGTGKEVLARAIHAMGPRAQKPFIWIHCAGIQENLIESELFGHEAGAFTNAQKKKNGLMEVADGGVLFLDEISSMKLDMQVKLLRALDDQRFRRVGGVTEIKVDTQIIAASNRNLPAMIHAGTFREDLYYRLKVVDLHLIPLRNRKVDIPALLGQFIRQINLRTGNSVQGATPRCIAALKGHDWPGNIRELRHVIERSMLFCDGDLIDLPHLPPEFAQYQ